MRFSNEDKTLNTIGGLFLPILLVLPLLKINDAISVYTIACHCKVNLQANVFFYGPVGWCKDLLEFTALSPSFVQ